MAERLNGKVAIVTGGGQGMGAAMAEAFVAEGASVLVTDVQEAAGKELVTTLGERAEFFQHDVVDLDQWNRAVAAAESAFGPVSILVNNAGISDWGGVVDMTEATFRRVMDVNTVGVFLGMKAVVDSMTKAGGGSII